MQAEGIRTGDRGHGWEAIGDATIQPDGRTVRVVTRTTDGRTNPAYYTVGEHVALTWGAGGDMQRTVKYPPGTPEYDEYRGKLTEELRKFVAGESPYDN